MLPPAVRALTSDAAAGSYRNERRWSIQTPEQHAMQTRGLVEWMDTRLYPGQGRNWDDVSFRGEVLARLRPADHLLDLGAGAGIVPQMNFKGACERVCGVDPDPRVVDNPYLDEGRVGMGESLPYPDGAFDVVVADNVLEHLDRPDEVFREVARVLKPGGRFLVKTPNKWHYVATLARLTPHGVHRRVNRLRGRAGEDTFPTRYRANSRAALKGIAGRTGYRLRSFRLREGRPEYMRLHPALYTLGWLYERAVNGTRALARFRVVLTAELEKRA